MSIQILPFLLVIGKLCIYLYGALCREIVYEFSCFYTVRGLSKNMTFYVLCPLMHKYKFIILADEEGFCRTIEVLMVKYFQAVRQVLCTWNVSSPLFLLNMPNLLILYRLKTVDLSIACYITQIGLVSQTLREKKNDKYFVISFNSLGNLFENCIFKENHQKFPMVRAIIKL